MIKYLEYPQCILDYQKLQRGKTQQLDSVNSIYQTYFYCEFYFKMQHMLISYVPVSKVNDGLIITFPDRKKHKISIKRTSRKIKDQILFSPVMYSTLSSFRGKRIYKTGWT